MTKEVTYVSREAPKYKIYGFRDRTLQFNNGTVTLDDPEDIKAMDKLIAENVNVSQLVSKVDIEAAEKIALAHKERMLKERSGTKGGVTAAAILDAQKLRRDAEIQSQGVSPEDLKKANDLLLTSQNEPPVNSPNDGFVPKKSEENKENKDDKSSAFAKALSNQK